LTAALTTAIYTLVAFVLACIASLDRSSPDKDHVQKLALSIARVALDSPALFTEDEDRHKTVATLVAVSFRESGWHADAIGDCTTNGKDVVQCNVPGAHDPQSFCAFQIHRSSGGGPALLADVDTCTRKGLALLRTSMKVCPGHPIAWYAAGPKGCTDDRAQRISRDRMNLAAFAAKSAKAKTAETVP
jgi:hypothetical protein